MQFLNAKKSLSKILGQQGEEMAQDFLLKNNFIILEKNWRRKRYEVDIICSHNQILHFVEVKTRKLKYVIADAALAVGHKKIENLKLAAEIYLFENPSWQRIQFDIIAINIYEATNETELSFIEDVF